MAERAKFRRTDRKKRIVITEQRQRCSNFFIGGKQSGNHTHHAPARGQGAHGEQRHCGYSGLCGKPGENRRKRQN